MTEIAQIPASAVKLHRAMAIAGWSLDFVDLDLTADRPKVTIRCRRSDGRWLHAHVDSQGRCSMETFQRETWLGLPSNAKRGSRLPQSQQINDVFLGRIRAEGPRALLRVMTNYIADNALSPVALADVRGAWASVMGAPLLLAAN